MDQPATVQITTEQRTYIASLLAGDSSFADLIRSRPNIRIGPDEIVLDRSDVTVLDDYFGDRLARIGFDVNYEPNEEGVLLEVLIDALFPHLVQTMVDPPETLVAVGTVIADRPPQRSVRARLRIRLL